MAAGPLPLHTRTVTRHPVRNNPSRNSSGPQVAIVSAPLHPWGFPRLVTQLSWLCFLVPGSVPPALPGGDPSGGFAEVARQTHFCRALDRRRPDVSGGFGREVQQVTDRFRGSLRACFRTFMSFWVVKQLSWSWSLLSRVSHPSFAVSWMCFRTTGPTLRFLAMVPRRALLKLRGKLISVVRLTDGVMSRKPKWGFSKMGSEKLSQNRIYRCSLLRVTKCGPFCNSSCDGPKRDD